jgi:excisionase family DNA binding protein
MANQSIPPEPAAIRIREAAKLLGVCERTVWKWGKEGIIPTVRVGRVTLYPVAELRAWLSQQASRQQATGTAPAQEH